MERKEKTDDNKEDINCEPYETTTTMHVPLQVVAVNGNTRLSCLQGFTGVNCLPRGFLKSMHKQPTCILLQCSLSIPGPRLERFRPRLECLIATQNMHLTALIWPELKAQLSQQCVLRWKKRPRRLLSSALGIRQ